MQSLWKTVPRFLKELKLELLLDQSLSHVRLFATPWTAARQASLSITNSRSLIKLMSIESVMLSIHLTLCCPLLLPSILPSIRVFSNESTLRIRWPKYWSFSFNIIPSKEHPGLIYFRIDWLDLPAVQGTLKSLLQHHSSKAVILEPPQIACHCFYCFSIYLPWSDGTGSLHGKWTELNWLMGLDVMILVFWMLSFKPTFSLSSFNFIKRLFTSSLSAIRVVLSAYLRLLIFLSVILIPAYTSSSPAFLMMYSV